MSEPNPIKRIFDLYTSDLKFDEIERLVKRESAEVYEFYKNQIPKVDTNKNKFTRTLIFIRSLFNAFLLKMTAPRRIFYIVALLLFFIGYINNIGSYLIFSFLIINILLAFELADKLTVKDELSLARKIQNNLMPQNPPDVNGFEIASFYESADEVGGDYFDFLKESEKSNEQYIVIGDISGKGMAAALYMVRVQAIIQYLIKNFNDLKDIIINLKDYFSQNLRREYFLTIQILKIYENKQVDVISAGHNPVLIYRSGSKTFIEVNPKGIGIGLNDKGLFEQTIAVESYQPSENDVIIMYTDGITETMNTEKVQFGIDRLKKIILDNSEKPANEIKQVIHKYLTYYRGNLIAEDDSTLIVIKVV
ncbi:MAG: SpoIIE family protein phosphatase [Melioribacteraceae bacterium]|nr:SpoIIE family protein phosphatase [Melioribacteraceae bacterium]